MQKASAKTTEAHIVVATHSRTQPQPKALSCIAKRVSRGSKTLRGVEGQRPSRVQGSALVTGASGRGP